jgi:protein-disulfide isomerase
MDKRFLSILAILVIVFGGIFIVSQNSSSDTSGKDGNSKAQPTNHVEGQNAKNITLIEYGDYQCPICGAYYQPLNEALSPDMLKNIHFQFRNLPLTSIHQNAFAAARAAEAAGLQGKYFEMHDMLYQNQNSWSESNSPINFFETYAKNLGLNVTQFKADYSSSKVNDAINADSAEFKKTGQQQATPTFFLNGKYVSNNTFADPSTGASTAEKITQYLNAEIAKQSASNSKQ